MTDFSYTSKQRKAILEAIPLNGALDANDMIAALAGAAALSIQRRRREAEQPYLGAAKAELDEFIAGFEKLGSWARDAIDRCLVKYDIDLTDVAEAVRDVKDWRFDDLPLMAFTARMLSNGKDARLVPMADLSEQLAWDDWGHLLTRVLVVPDFHVHGPKGFGIPPWRLAELRELLRVRMDKRLPTIISADDPWALDPEVGEIVDRHFMLARPEDVL